MTTHDDPRGTTALDALLASPELTFARTRIAAWQKYNANTIPLDAVDALVIALQAIDLLLAERPTPDVYAPPVGVCFTVYRTNREDSPDSHVFEQHKANPNGTPQCGTRYPLQPYAPFIAADLCPRCYPAPAQPSAPAVAATLEKRLTSGKPEDRTIARGEIGAALDLIARGKVQPIEGRDFVRMPSQPEAARAGAKLSASEVFVLIYAAENIDFTIGELDPHYATAIHLLDYRQYIETVDDQRRQGHLIRRITDAGRLALKVGAK